VAGQVSLTEEFDGARMPVIPFTSVVVAAALIGHRQQQQQLDPSRLDPAAGPC
jgi:hypothetical protein